LLNWYLYSYVVQVLTVQNPQQFPSALGQNLESRYFH